MILHGGLRPAKILKGSWRFLAVVTCWNLIVVFLDEVMDFHFVAHPTQPVTTVGVAVAFYLGFKNTTAFARWWEARNIWGEIVNASRDWGNAVIHLIPDSADAATREELIERHIAWLNALAFQLRSQTPLSRSRGRWMFGLGRLSNRAELHQTPDSYQRYLSEGDAIALEGKANKSGYLLFLQGRQLHALAEKGVLDSVRHLALMDRLAQFYATQGKCERIKNTPFPRQIAGIGELFTWIFIFMLPLAFVDLYTAPEGLRGWSRLASADYTLAMVPLSVLVCWIFFLTEKVSASMEDPFDGEATDVPISTISRIIEFDLRQMTGFGEVPKPQPPVNGILY